MYWYFMNLSRWNEFYLIQIIIVTFFLSLKINVLHSRSERSWERNFSMHIASSITFTKSEIYFHLNVAC